MANGSLVLIERDVHKELSSLGIEYVEPNVQIEEGFI